MELTLNWTESSRNELLKLFFYYKHQSNLKNARNKIEKISKQVLLLKKQPFIGQKEELLTGGKEEFRYLLFSNYKIIYYVNLELNRVEIVDLFDCRQEPLKIKRTK